MTSTSTSVPSTSAAIERLIDVTTMPDGTAEDRGLKVLAAASAVRNVNADMVSDHVRVLLATSAWRDYVLPNGNRYQWRSQEFDYFLSAAGLDPVLVDHVVRGSGDRALLVAVAEATSDRHDADRRSLSEVSSTYPDIANRLCRHPLAGTAVRKLIGKASAQRRFVNGSGADTANNPRQRWEVRWRGPSDTGTVAAIISARLLADPHLAQAVLVRLKESLQRNS